MDLQEVGGDGASISRYRYIASLIICRFLLLSIFRILWGFLKKVTFLFCVYSRQTNLHAWPRQVASVGKV
jgi:hypothetical protein